MASNFIPMLSSSPPPLDDCPDNDDDDDEFGTFTSANIPFDSSFDSPVAGEKYKPFKTGDNGVNNLALNNDLNTFCTYNDSQMSPATKFTLSFSPKIQRNCKKNSALNESEDEDQLFPDPSEQHSSSAEDIPSKDSFLTSQDCVPGSLHIVSDEVEDSSKACEEGDWFRRKEFSTCSTEETQNCELDSFDLNNSNCDADKKKKSLFVPPCDDESDENSDDVHVAHSEISNNLQSTGVLEKCEDSFCNVNTSRCVAEKSNNLQSKANDESSYCINETDNISENLNNDFPDLEARDQSDEFDDFQGAISVNNAKVNCAESSVVGCEDTGTFKANFTDFQTSETFCSRDNEFAGFQANEEGYHSEADEFDDFQSCGKTSEYVKEDASFTNSSSAVRSCEVPSFGKTVVTDSESEDFDEFQACPVVGASTDQGFANFEAESFSQKEDPEFADFEGASFSSVSSETFQSSSSHLSSTIPNQEKNVDKLSTVMNTIFPLAEEESSTVDVSYDPASEVLEQCNKSRRLWEKLHEVEQTPGARFQWGVSHSFQQLLRSVNVDYHSILRTSSVPIFASSLSLLEPVKGQTNSVSQDPEDRIQSPRDPIPPVEFDWNSSGLVNPLDSGQAVSMLMDLSFLSSSESITSTSIGNNSFENELLKPSPVPACSESNNKSLILEELLSKNVCSIPNSKTAHRPTNLSEEANCVLDQLPDLSFMRAKVLMFPISSKT